MADENKLIKVIFQYEDGTSKFIEGSELERWGGFNRQAAIFCQIHDNNPDWSQVKWTWVSNDTATVDGEPMLNVKSALD
jgi:hypothetical protein